MIGDAFSNKLLKFIFQAVAIANVADNAASTPATNIYVYLHTASPGDTGTTSTSGSTLAPVAVARTTGGWTVTGDVAKPVANITFGTPTAIEALTHISLSYSGTPGGEIIAQGALDSTINTTVGGVPPIVSNQTSFTLS